jgi:hypothetical protein
LAAHRTKVAVKLALSAAIDVGSAAGPARHDVVLWTLPLAICQQISSEPFGSFGYGHENLSRLKNEARPCRSIRGHESRYPADARSLREIVGRKWPWVSLMK